MKESALLKSYNQNDPISLVRLLIVINDVIKNENDVDNFKHKESDEIDV